MNQQPDKLFREKLLNYERSVSPDAWNRVSQKVARKDNKGLYVKAAAAVLLLVTGTWIFYSWMDPANPNHSSEMTPQTKVSPPAASKEDAPLLSEKQANTSPRDTVSAKQTLREPKSSDRNQRRTNKRKTQVEHPQSESHPQRTITSSDVAAEVPVVIPPSHEAQVAEEVAVAEVPDDGNKKRVTIIFNADEVNEKYLAKNVDAEATPSDEQSSGLKKLLDKANDLKHNQDLLGSLRQKKNEILAMNFRNEKELTQND